MKSFSILVVVCACLAAACAPAARAQASRPAPILNRANPVRVPPPKVSGIWLKAEVIHADAHVLIVREQADSLKVHTFSYAPEIKARMQQIEDAGGYQYGDKIKILCNPNGSVAFRVRGKPSKSS